MSLEAADQHKLQRSWTLWYDSPSTYNGDNWELSLIPIMSVNTVEEFFAMYKYMKPLRSLRTSAQYHFFQTGVKPMWEDPANKNGGKLWVNIDVKRSNRLSADAGEDAQKTELDSIWENVLMALVGEYLEDESVTESQVIGVVMAKRRYHNRLAVWVKDKTATDAIEEIRKRVTKEAKLPSSMNLVFTDHEEKA